MITIEGYHGTDLECAKKILTEGFRYKHSDKHWLGNGNYFYLDHSLAEWWTTNPSRKFGVNIKVPSIIKVKIEVEKDKCVDLRKLEDFKDFSDIYFKDFIPLLKGTGIPIRGDNRLNIRTKYCDYLKKAYNKEVIIGSFLLMNQPYLKDRKDYYLKLNKHFNLIYEELQMCVFNNENIVSKEVIEKARWNNV